MLDFEEYAKIEFLNDVPEIVCDILCYLARYFHYRTSQMTERIYQKALISQV